MIKYTDTAVTLREIPDEITLCINISNCPCHCKGCHSSYLAEDIGKPLDEDSLVELMLDNKGITSESPNYEEEKEKALKEARAITEAEHAKVVEAGGLHVIGTERH